MLLAYVTRKRRPSSGIQSPDGFATLVWTVSDTGIGIQADRIGRLFAAASKVTSENVS